MNSQIVVQDICFIRADPDSNLYFYCAAAPSVTVTHGNQPAVQLEIFRNSREPTTLYYATLSLRTQLASTPKAARAAADASADIPRNAILMPLQAISCSATLDIPGFITGQTSKTSLNDQQNCYLLAKLIPQDSIVLLASLMKDPEATPVAISYKIDYLQQLPPASYELEASWEKVYLFLQESLGFNLLLFNVDIERVSSSLISKKIVTIKVRQTDSSNYLEQAGAELKQILLSEFFTAVFADMPQQPKPKAGFYLQQVSVKDIDQRRLSGKLSLTTVVKRSLFPQALFAKLVSDTDYQADRVITRTDLQDDFFAYRNVRINLLTPELDSNISLVIVRLDYGGNIQQFTFCSGDNQPKRFKMAAIIDPNTQKMLWPVHYDFTIYFIQPFGDRIQAESSVLQTELDDIYLDLDSIYGRYNFIIGAASQFDWSWYQSVLVTLRCSHRLQPAPRVSESFQISATSPPVHYPVTLANPDLYLFEVTKEYCSALNSPHISGELIEPANQDITLFSRLYKQRELTLCVDVNWNEIEQVMVSASYAYCSTDRNAILQQVFLFTGPEVAVQRFSADQPDLKRKTINLSIWFTYFSEKRGGKPDYVEISTDQNSIDINLN